MWERNAGDFREPDFWVFEVVNRGIGDDTAKCRQPVPFSLVRVHAPQSILAWMATTRITYCFLFPDGRSRVYEVVLDAETGRQVSVPLGSHHAWTDLEYEKCRHCPLKREEHPECPAAKNLAFVVDDFQLEQSFEKVLVEVVTAERTYRKE